VDQSPLVRGLILNYNGARRAPKAEWTAGGHDLDNQLYSEDSVHQAYGHQDDKAGLGRLQANVHNGEQDEMGQ